MALFPSMTPCYPRYVAYTARTMLVPQTHLLSNGRYSVMITSAGSGYSRWRDIGMTRWREDTTRDDTGSYLFLRDIESGAVWSAGYQPSGIEPKSYQVTFAEDHAEFIRTDGSLTTTLEIVVSPEDDAEVRRLSITNTGHRDRIIEVTSYAELVLASPAADAAHQSFLKLFVQTEYVAKSQTLLATRRKRAPDEADIWAAYNTRWWKVSRWVSPRSKQIGLVSWVEAGKSGRRWQ